MKRSRKTYGSTRPSKITKLKRRLFHKNWQIFENGFCQFFIFPGQRQNQFRSTGFESLSQDWIFLIPEVDDNEIICCFVAVELPGYFWRTGLYYKGMIWRQRHSFLASDICRLNATSRVMIGLKQSLCQHTYLTRMIRVWYECGKIIPIRLRVILFKTYFHTSILQRDTN